MTLTKIFKDFFDSEKAGGIVLVLCTILSLALTNSAWQHDYLSIWHFQIAGSSFEHWINDGLMTIFFLMIGLELEREIYKGELSDIRNALLPVSGALGGMLVPAGLFLLFNYGTPTQAGAGVPMATDIAFALGILALMGSKIPASLKIFLTALAVIDDLGAIIIIAVFYTSQIHVASLLLALLVFAILMALNFLFKVRLLFIYLLGGVAMWYFMLQSGVHATIAGVLLAFAIPFGDGSEQAPSYKLQHFLHKPVAFIILPLFALANTCIVIHNNWAESFYSSNGIGILAGLVLGKPLGIILFTSIAVATGICALPNDVRWKHIAGAGMLAGIGFTMSIFIINLAYTDAEHINQSKFMVMSASLIAGVAGLIWLAYSLRKKA